MFNFSKKYFIGFFCAGILLSACVLPEKEDPFERLPEEKVETIGGEIFPFSVSVSTRATHRLEEDGKLQAYLASKVVRLEDFEGREVEVDGVFRTEKMRPVFWVEKIRLKDIEKKKEEEKDLVFETKKFRFIYPKDWEYTTAPNGMAYFLDRIDPARRVFLTFSVEDLSSEDKKTDPNILIANLAGTKEITQDNLGREGEKLILFSNLYKKKYTFIFTHTFEEFEKKKSFFKLLSSFVEGEDNIQKIKDEELKKLAEKEKEKLDEEALAAEALSAQKEQDRKESEQEDGEEESESLLEKFFGKTNEPVVEKKEDIKESSQSVTTEVVVGEFKNLIDVKSFSYQSTYYKFSMKVPYGFWFRNFGQNEESIAEIGFSDQDFSKKTGARFWLRILGDQTPPKEIVERMEEDRLILQIPRSEKSFFEFSGPVEFRDAMWSILKTIETF
ncbi:hypothetical protein KAI58_03460 [Candidatus Gracilibacteria bacterium]|nr:hypothetical protein [Candidatus Gracilibacteria bacterium]